MAIIIILAPLLVSLGAAAMRSVTGLPLGEMCVVALVLYAALSAMCRGRISIFGQVSPRVSYQALAVALACLAPFYVPSSNGFVNLGTADGGNHVRFYQSFVSTTPDVYNGFVGFYALIFLFEKTLNLWPELALLFAIGYSMFVVTWILSLWAISRGASIVALLGLNLVVIAPTAIALQASGFYPQLYGLSILGCLMLVCDRVIAPRGVVSVTLAGVGLLRYAYGLTVSDVFFGGGAYLLTRRKFYGGALLIALGAYTLSRLLSVITLVGAFTPIFTLGLIASIALLLVVVQERDRLSYWLVMSSFVTWLGLGISFGFEHYYIQKYSMGLCLVAGVFVLPYVSSERFKPKAIALLSFLFLCGAVYPYTRNAVDIARGRYVNPEVDRALVITIREALSSSDKPFRVFIGNKWARTNMVNALFGREFSYSRFESGALPVEPGCVFFDATDGVAQRLKRDKFPEVSRLVDRLVEAPHTRVTYAAPWAAAGRLTLGIVCEK
jgi:hypothetical protein